jgi:DNA-binding PucR family transcriptional regulator
MPRLEHDRQAERAARVLHIHLNTLLYRVRGFEQVSGCSTESLAEIWLAMRATAAVPDVAHGPSAGLGFQDS